MQLYLHNQNNRSVCIKLGDKEIFKTTKCTIHHQGKSK